MMQHENQNGIRLNAAGEPDLDYYIAKAHGMRSQAIATGLRAAKHWVYRTCLLYTSDAADDSALV